MSEMIKIQQSDILENGMTDDDIETSSMCILDYLENISDDDFLFVEYGIRQGKYENYEEL